MLNSWNQSCYITCVDFLTTPLGHLPEPQSEGSNNSPLATKTAEMESPAISTPTAFTQRVSQIQLQLKVVSLGRSRCVDGDGYSLCLMGRGVL